MKISVHRLLISLFVLFLVLFVAWREMVNPVFTGIAACFHVHTEEMNVIYEQAIATDDMSARKELICTADVESTSNLRSCLREVKSEYMLGDVLINSIPRLGLNTMKRVNFAVRDHNRQCPEMPIAEERV